MSEISEAEQYLLEQIRHGDNESWQKFVLRFQGRLVAFARKQLRSAADADDVVQETFVSFIQAMNNFRGQCGLDTYLFVILRRKILNVYRQKKSLKAKILNAENYEFNDGDSSVFDLVDSNEPTASWYVRRDETKEQLFNVLSRSILDSLDDFKKTLRFDQLIVIELLFLKQVSNAEAADVSGVSAGGVGTIKHRFISKVASAVSAYSLQSNIEGNIEGMLAKVWQEYRPSCPKRSTIGAYLLGTLDDEWSDYVRRHIDSIGCEFCKANYDDLNEQNQCKGSNKLEHRIIESTIGFLNKV